MQHQQDVADKDGDDGHCEAGDDGNRQVQPLALLRHSAHQVVLLTARPRAKMIKETIFGAEEKAAGAHPHLVPLLLLVWY